MIKILRDKSIAAILLLIITAALVHCHLLMQPISFSNNEVGFLGSLISTYKTKLVPQFWVVIYFVLIFSQALQLNFLLGKRFSYWIVLVTCTVFSAQ